MPDGTLAHRELRRQVDPGSPEDQGTVPGLPGAACPSGSPTAWSRVADLAWRTMRGEGYGRVDLRVNDAGQP